MIQFLGTPSTYYIKSVRTVLKCCRKSAKLTVVGHDALAELYNLHILGEITGFLGKILADGISYLLIITEVDEVGTLGPNDDPVLRVKKVVAVPVVDDNSLNKIEGFSSGLDRLKNQQKKLMKFVTSRAGTSVKIIDEVLRLLNDSETFYYCASLDLTANTQRRAANEVATVNEFFWNRQLLNDFYDSSGIPLPNTSEWIIRLIHGYFDQRHLSYENDSELRLTLVSRRSTCRAGVRYLRRGLDAEGHVANFVESEMIIRIFGHILSYIQIRGSIPLFWSQKGFRYRPPLAIDKPLTESLPSCREHFSKILKEYGSPVTVVNLVDQRGRELALGEAFLQHILELDAEDLKYVAFDFHDHCRALKFDRVSILLNVLETDMGKMGFCWIDRSGQMVREQKGVIRTNCVDCLDRTNVVQSAISQVVCSTQCQKLGLIEPFADTPEVLVQVLQSMWADHGDCISRQYAGTNALKGDITRGGQRNLMGLVKDGYNSASRYYLSHVRDAQRQRAIEALASGYGTTLLKNTETEMAAEATSGSDTDDNGGDEESEDESENIGRVVHETARFILPADEALVGGWALVDGVNQSDQVDTVLLLTRNKILIASYADEDTEKLLEVKTVMFDSIERIEIGSLGKSVRLHLRICWTQANAHLFCSFRAAKTRLFNNVAIHLKDGTEADEYIGAIAEQIRITLQMCGYDIDVVRLPKLSGNSSNREREKYSFVTSLSSKLKLRDNQPSIHQSKSESQLTEMPSSKAGLIFSKIQSKIKAPISQLRPSAQTEMPSSASAVPSRSASPPQPPAPTETDRFSAYAQGILKSKSCIIIL